MNAKDIMTRDIITVSPNMNVKNLAMALIKNQISGAPVAGKNGKVVGVVSDVRQNGVQAPVGTEIYVPHRQARLLMSGFMPRTMNVVVRAAGDPAAVAGAIRGAVRELDPAAAVSGLAPMQTIVDRTIAQPSTGCESALPACSRSAA